LPAHTDLGDSKIIFAPFDDPDRRSRCDADGREMVDEFHQAGVGSLSVEAGIKFVSLPTHTVVTATGN
jgi:hypothetical protein